MEEDIKFSDGLVQGVDYFLSPEGYRIMSEEYLRNRGYC